MKIELDPHPEPEPKYRRVPDFVPSYAPPRAQVVQPHQPVAQDVALWNPNAAANWSLPFSPIFGAILQAHNWRALGEPERAKRSMLWCYACLALYLVLPFVVLSSAGHESTGMIARGIAFWFLIFWYFLSARPQARYVKERHGDAYERRAWGTPLLVALGGVLAYYVYAFVLGTGVGIARHVAR
ncbi:MAG: hypothetical protein HY014_18475 [Acidobacteria bacterium]|nr:hypothetical protein [Acidobacteriota bacterium]MBI3490124.1 hypothetical protein [Acidobacteriota bacterium]